MSEQNTTESSRVKCRSIMTSGVSTAEPNETVVSAAGKLREGDIGMLPVVDPVSATLLGVVTDRDIVVRLVAEGADAGETKVEKIMTTELFTAGPEDFAFEAIRIMGDRQVRRIPIVDDHKRLLGIVSMADIALEMEDEREIAETLEDISSGAAFWSKQKI